MEDILTKIINRAKADTKTIVLPEVEDERVLRAAGIISKEKIAKIVLIGNKDDINKKANDLKVNLEQVIIIDPLYSDKYDTYVEYLYNIRKEKGLTIDQAKELVKDPVYFGVLMVKMNEADGLVSGAIHSTADTLRPALQIIKAKGGNKLVSSFFLMDIPNSKYETEYIFSDCGLIVSPNFEELAQIAIQSAETYKLLVEKEPKVAMLSYSTLGSAKSDEVETVIKATKMVKEQRPDVIIDGELQLDAAIDAKVAGFKAPNSKVAGQANVLVFPNLSVGNIGYKLVERFGGANAFGPITQGLDKPINDLSRGCKIMDIIGVVAITAIQASVT